MLISAWLIGLFLIVYVSTYIILSIEIANNNGIILFMILAIGIFQILLSIFGFYGVRIKNLEYLNIFLVLTPIEIAL
jgi:hypothetical protein